MIKSLERQDYREIFNLSKRVEAYPSHNFYDQFCDNLDRRRGFTIWNNEGRLVGMVSYSDFIAGYTVLVHFLQDSDQPGSVTKGAVLETFRFPFLRLYVPRMISYCIPGITDKAGEFLKRLGFREEGILRQAAQLPDGNRDIIMYGMLKSECRWI